MGDNLGTQEHLRAGLVNGLQSQEEKVDGGVWQKAVEGLSGESHLPENCDQQILDRVYLC